jgi:hypothetical protein
VSLFAANQMKAHGAREDTLGVGWKFFSELLDVHAVVQHKRLVSGRIIDGHVEVSVFAEGRSKVWNLKCWTCLHCGVKNQ